MERLESPLESGRLWQHFYRQDSNPPNLGTGYLPIQQVTRGAHIIITISDSTENFLQRKRVSRQVPHNMKFFGMLQQLCKNLAGVCL